MFGVISGFMRMRKFFEYADKTLHLRANIMAQENTEDSDFLFEDYALTTSLMMAQIVAITSGSLNGRLRIALLSTFSRSYEDNKENLVNYFEYSDDIGHHANATLENRKEMYYYVGKWTVDMVNSKNEVYFHDFSDEYITEVGDKIYNIALESAMNSKLVK